MDDRLKNLKRAMTKHTFADLKFTDEQRVRVLHKLAGNIEGDIFSLLTEPKTASELIQQLHVKGIRAIFQNEGLVFSTLHLAELNEEVRATWNEVDEKQYMLTKKGMHKYATGERTRIQSLRGRLMRYE